MLNHCCKECDVVQIVHGSSPFSDSFPGLLTDRPRNCSPDGTVRWHFTGYFHRARTLTLRGTALVVVLGNSKLGSGRSSYCALTREFPATSPFRVGFGTPWWPFGALRAPRRFWRPIQSSHKGATARESWPRFHPLTAHDPRRRSCSASQLSPTKEDCAVWPFPAAVSVSEADRGAAWNQATPRRHLVCISACFVRESSIVRAQGRVDS